MTMTDPVPPESPDAHPSEPPVLSPLEKVQLALLAAGFTEEITEPAVRLEVTFAVKPRNKAARRMDDVTHRRLPALARASRIRS